MKSRLTFVLGGARSGKSRYAEAAIATLGSPPWIYIATAQAFDAEMAERIERHRLERGKGWITIDAPHELAAAVTKQGRGERPVLIDCLTLWLSNRLLAGADLAAESAALTEVLFCATAPMVVVSNEVGLGIVPENRLARCFRDAAGRLHQMLAAKADRVVLVVAGLPITVK